jgi:hypothetical protein
MASGKWHGRPQAGVQLLGEELGGKDEGVIIHRIRNETSSEISRLAEALPGAERALEAGVRQTIRDAIDLNLSPPQASIIKRHVHSEIKLDALVLGTMFDAIMLFQTDLGRKVALSIVAVSDADMQRPFRVKEYAKKFLGFLPSGFLNIFWKSCLKLGLEETVRVFESPKGEANAKDFFGEPRGIDLDPDLVQRVVGRARAAADVKALKGDIVDFIDSKLGLTVSILTEEQREAIDLPAEVVGVVVTEVVEGSPAHKAGLRGCDRKVARGIVEVPVGGDIVIEADGKTTRTIQEFIQWLRSKPAVSSLRVYRNGSAIDLTLSA